MKLTAKVTEVISGSESRDGQQRVKLKVAEADSMFKSLIVANADGLALDDELTLLVLTKEQAANICDDLIPLVNAKVDGFVAFRNLCDQLRPDPPPPFMEPPQVDAETHAAHGSMKEAIV